MVKIIGYRPAWLSLKNFRYLEDQLGLIFEQRGLLREQLKQICAENETLREANRQKQALIERLEQELLVVKSAER